MVRLPLDRGDSFGLDEIVREQRTGDTHAFLDMIHRGSRQFQPVKPACIAAKRKAAAITHENAGFLDPITLPHGARLLIRLALTMQSAHLPHIGQQ